MDLLTPSDSRLLILVDRLCSDRYKIDNIEIIAEQSQISSLIPQFPSGMVATAKNSTGWTSYKGLSSRLMECRMNDMEKAGKDKEKGGGPVIAIVVALIAADPLLMATGTGWTLTLDQEYVKVHQRY